MIRVETLGQDASSREAVKQIYAVQGNDGAYDVHVTLPVGLSVLIRLCLAEHNVESLGDGERTYEAFLSTGQLAATLHFTPRGAQDKETPTSQLN